MNYTVDFPTSVVAAIAVILLSIIYYFVKNRNILPGPRGVPYFGLFPFLRNETIHLQLEEYGRKYGDLFSFTSFGTLLINLGSPRAMKELHVAKSDCFETRQETFSFLTYCLKNGVAFSNNENWKVQRKFFVQAFRQYGMSAIRENTAGPLYESIVSLLEDVRNKNGQPINVTELLTDKCMLALRKALFGTGITDEQSRGVLKAWTDTYEAQFGRTMLVMGPIGKLMFQTVPKYRRFLAQHEIMLDILMETARAIESDMSEDHPTCVVEEFIAERRRRRQKNDPTSKYFSDIALCESLFQFFGDGVATVALFIGIFLQALVEHPEEQEKIHQELMDVVGPNRLPTAEDRSNLSYTSAFMNEVMRTADFPLVFPSMLCTKETTVRGYRIPKGSLTLINTWQAHHDPNTYDQPYKFDPTRFLAKEGKPKTEPLVLFGVGKRACIGEAFTMLESFLYFTSIVHNFTVSQPEEFRDRTLTGDLMLVLKPRK